MAPGKRTRGTRERALATDRDTTLLVELLKFATLISRPMKSFVADHHGLAVNELRVVMCLSGEGELSGQEIADLMSMTGMNVSRALASLEQRRWVTRSDDPANRRRRLASLTPRGWREYRKVLVDVHELSIMLFSDLDGVARRRLLTTITTLIDSLGSLTNGAPDPRRITPSAARDT